MSARGVLERLVAVPGVRGACLASADGALLEGSGEPAEVLAETAAAAADGWHTGGEVGALYGDGPARSVTVEFDAFVVLVAPVGGPEAERLLVLRLRDRGALGRARRELEGAAPDLPSGAGAA